MRKDVTRRPLVSAEMLGMPGFVVLAAGEYGGELELLTETVETTTGCPDCGVVAEVHARRPHLVRDVPAGGRPVLLVWSKGSGGARNRIARGGRGPRRIRKCGVRRR